MRRLKKVVAGFLVTASLFSLNVVGANGASLSVSPADRNLTPAELSAFQVEYADVEKQVAEVYGDYQKEIGEITKAALAKEGKSSISALSQDSLSAIEATNVETKKEAIEKIHAIYEENGWELVEQDEAGDSASITSVYGHLSLSNRS